MHITGEKKAGIATSVPVSASRCGVIEGRRALGGPIFGGFVGSAPVAHADKVRLTIANFLQEFLLVFFGFISPVKKSRNWLQEMANVVRFRKL
jgi:hypothetical protein